MYNRRMTYSLLSALFLSTFYSITEAGNVYKIRKPQSKYDASHSYYVGLLERALQETEAEYGEASVSYQVTVNQGRDLIELKSGEIINVAMLGTTPDREKTLLPIRVPLSKGLLGYRVFIIHKDNEGEFDQIRSLDALKKKTACQGLHWPDSDILEVAQIPVIRNQDYESMFEQVLHKRCDFFPRGINEAFIEMRVREKSYPELVIYKKLVLSYTFPMYFFVSPKRPELAERLEKGMSLLLSKGEIDDYIRDHPITRDLFPLEQWNDTLELTIDNPFLPKAMDLDLSNSHLWLKIPFKQSKIIP